MRSCLVVAAVLLAACGSTPTQVASGTREPASASAPATASPAGFGFDCRLPVAWFPSNVKADPTNSGTGFVDTSQGVVTGKAQMPKPLFLTLGPSYYAAVGRWLPVPSSAIAPDGLQYAYAEWDPPPTSGASVGVRGASAGVPAAAGPMIGSAGRVHVVDARTGADRVVFAGQPTFSIIRFAPEGLYLGRFFASVAGSGTTGLYLLNPAGGTPQPIAGADYQVIRGWRFLDAEAGWGTRYSPAPGQRMGGNQVVRFDLATHAVTAWLTVSPDYFVAVLGLYKGNPIVLTMKASISAGEPIGARVLLLTGPEESTQLLATDKASDSLPYDFGSSAADSHGLWIGGSASLWLYNPASGLRHIYLLAADSVVTIGGPCA